MKTTIPAQSEPISIGGGPINPNWYPALKSLEKLSSFTQSISGSFAVTPLTPGNTTVTVTVGAISDSGNNGTGVVHSFIGYNSVGTTAQVLQTLYDSFSTIAFYINTIRTDLGADQTAVGALNTRITALENKLNAVISDLDARFP